MTKEIRILGTRYLDEHTRYWFNEEFEGKHYCGKDFQKGWRVRIEVPKYKRKGTEFREGVIDDIDVDSVIDKKGVKLLVKEEFRGRRDRIQPRVYSYHKIINAWLIQQ